MSNIQSKHIQILRGIAIIAVVGIHTAPDGIYQVFLRPFLNFSVGLFLFLSGMLSSAENWKPGKRLAKVLIPYIIWTLMYTVMKGQKNVFVDFFVNLTTGRTVAMMYYIFVYCEFTLLIPLIDKLAKSKFKYLGFAIAPIEIVVMRMLPLIMGYKVNESISIIMSVSCLGWFTYFYLGYLVGNNIIKINTSTKKLICCLTVSIFVQIIEGYWWHSIGSSDCGSQLKLSSVLTGTIFVILAYFFINAKKEYNNKIIERLGDISFGIFFSHIAVMKMLSLVPYYSNIVFFPLNTSFVIIVDAGFIYVGKKILGKYSKYFAL